MKTIDDSSPAQKPGVDVPCPTRKQGCDDSQGDGQIEPQSGSVAESVLLDMYQSHDGGSAREIYEYLLAPEWNVNEMYSWESCADYRLREVWHAMPLVAKLAAAYALMIAARESSHQGD